MKLLEVGIRKRDVNRVILGDYEGEIEAVKQLEYQLTGILNSLIGHQITLTMQINQLTPICKMQLALEGYQPWALPIETSSKDYVAYGYRLIHREGYEVTFPFNQLRGIENTTEGYLFYFPNLQWEINKET